MILVDKLFIRSYISRFFALLIGLVCIYFAYSYNQNSIYKYEGNIFGTYWRVSSSEFINQRYIDGIRHLLNEIDHLASNYKEDSELNLLNKAPLNKEIALSPDLFKLIETATRINYQSSGVYDITVTSIVNKLGFGPNLFTKKDYKFISPIDKYELITEKNSLIKINDVVFDLSSIAKGYAVDKVLTYLKKNDFNNVLIDIGGEIAVVGFKNEDSWTVGITNPNMQLSNDQFVIRNREGEFLGIATSGDYLNFNYQNGVKKTHTIDPRLGDSKQNNIISVSVISLDSTELADAYATTLNAMDLNEAIKFAEINNIACLIIYKDLINDSSEVYFSTTWHNFHNV